MKCKVCGKESPLEICKSCIQLQAEGLSNEQILLRKQKEIKSNDLEYLLSLSFLSRDTKILFTCEKCKKPSKVSLRHIREAKNLICSKCTSKETLQKNYGVNSIFGLDSIKEKITKTNLEKYGKTSFLATDKAREARYKIDEEYFKKLAHDSLDDYSIIEFTNEKYRRVLDENGHLKYQELKCICKTCNIEYTTNSRRLCRCPKCFPEDWQNGTSKLEKNVLEYIKSIYNGEVLENTRSIISPKELDIYLPELKLAIEVNGDYWHGAMTIPEFKSKIKIAGEKQELCNRKGIRLITLQECDLRARPNVFKRFLQDAILPRIRVYARDCKFCSISTQEARDFCEYYHVNGYRPSQEKYGLKYKDELICVATFSPHKVYEWECIRLCYKTRYSIIGGWDRIIKHFGRQFLHYVNLKYFPGENKTGIGFRYEKNGKVLSRNTLQRTTQLSKYCGNIDREKSDIENCLANGWKVVFDCGNDRRIYNESTN